MTATLINPEMGLNMPISISAGVNVTAETLSAGRTIVVTGEAMAESEYALLPLDAIFVRSVEDLGAIRFSDDQPLLVTKAGFAVAAELIKQRLLNPSSSIIWSLQAPLGETLEQLGLLDLPVDTAVQGIWGTAERSFVRTAIDSGDRLDSKSFNAGMAVDLLLRGHEARTEPADGDDSLHELNLLRRKHLSLLEELIPAADPLAVAALAGPSDSELKLNDELDVLKSRYEALKNENQALSADFLALEDKHNLLVSAFRDVDDEHKTLNRKFQALDSSYSVLERKYQALSNSRLGKLTLRLWGRKSPRTNDMKLKEEA
ncbi:hypothetical protein OHC50_13890 [Paenarthrobacter ilicis]|uniref:hypothetical protein n=1 Tax=Paenarthrobacter ilicis TaxID=43665 RepID=UPI00300BF930